MVRKAVWWIIDSGRLRALAFAGVHCITAPTRRRVEHGIWVQNSAEFTGANAMRDGTHLTTAIVAGGNVCSSSRLAARRAPCEDANVRSIARRLRSSERDEHQNQAAHRRHRLGISDVSSVWGSQRYFKTIYNFIPGAQSTGSHERETTRVERWLYGLIVYILLTSVQLEA